MSRKKNKKVKWRQTLGSLCDFWKIRHDPKTKRELKDMVSGNATRRRPKGQR